MSPAIECHGVMKRYRGRQVLDDISFVVQRGAVFALLGPNGVGKSTLIRLLLGLTGDDGGSIRVLGLDPRTEGLEIRRRVGFVPDDPVLYDWMTVDETGWFVAGFQAPGYLDEYRRVVAELGVPPRERVKNLSRGTRAQVSLAIALAARPELLVMDEPTLGLDPHVRRQFVDRVIDVAADGRTVLLSSHQVDDVERVADWVGFLDGGRLRPVRRLDELKDQTREIWITGELDGPPEFSGTRLSCERRGRSWRLLAEGVDVDELESLRGLAGVERVEWRTPSLEELYLALCRPAPVTSTPAKAPREARR